MSTLITNIAELTTNVSTGGDLTGTVLDAAVLIEGERIACGRRRGRTGGR